MSVEIYEKLDSTSCSRFDRNTSEICELLEPVHFDLTVDLFDGSLELEFSQISILNTDSGSGHSEEIQYSGYKSMSEYSHVFKFILVSMFILEMIILLVTSIMILAKTWRSSNKVRNNTKVFKSRSSPKVGSNSHQGIEVINGDTLSHGVYIGQWRIKNFQDHKNT